MTTAAKELLVEKGVQTTTSLLERNDQGVVLRSRNRQQNLKDKDDSLASSAMLQQIDNDNDDIDIGIGCGPLSLTHRVTASSKKKPLHSLMKSKKSDDSQKQQHNNHPSEKQSSYVQKCILTSSAVTKTNLKDLPTLPAKSPITPLNSNADNNHYSYPLS